MSANKTQFAGGLRSDDAAWAAEHVIGDAKLGQMVTAFLNNWKTASVATVGGGDGGGGDGGPHACNVFYAMQEVGGTKTTGSNRWRLFWVSSVDTSHSVNLACDDRAAITIYAHVRLPSNVHGIQMHGRVTMIEPDSESWQDAWVVYSHKYPFVKNSPLRERVMAERFYCFDPTWLRWVDNRRYFGFKQEMSFIVG